MGCATWPCASAMALLCISASRQTVTRLRRCTRSRPFRHFSLRFASVAPRHLSRARPPSSATIVCWVSDALPRHDSMNALAASSAEARAAFDRLLGELRPRLHRYCARMTGSVIDGEDVVQEALVKAIEAFTATPSIDKPEAWLFRIAHNAALDFLRRRARLEARSSGEDLDMIIDPSDDIADRQAAAASLHTFMRLPVTQRSSVILMDVLGYSLDEISGVTDATIPSVKAALHRGRARLRQLAQEPDDRPPPALAAPERARLATYIDRFNARDFDAVRNMLADEVRL